MCRIATLTLCCFLLTNIAVLADQSQKAVHNNELSFRPDKNKISVQQLCHKHHCLLTSFLRHTGLVLETDQANNLQQLWLQQINKLYQQSSYCFSSRFDPSAQQLNVKLKEEQNDHFVDLNMQAQINNVSSHFKLNDQESFHLGKHAVLTSLYVDSNVITEFDFKTFQDHLAELVANSTKLKKLKHHYPLDINGTVTVKQPDQQVQMKLLFKSPELADVIVHLQGHFAKPVNINNLFKNLSGKPYKRRRQLLKGLWHQFQPDFISVKLVNRDLIETFIRLAGYGNNNTALTRLPLILYLKQKAILSDLTMAGRLYNALAQFIIYPYSIKASASLTGHKTDLYDLWQTIQQIYQFHQYGNQLSAVIKEKNLDDNDQIHQRYQNAMQQRGQRIVTMLETLQNQFNIRIYINGQSYRYFQAISD